MPYKSERERERQRKRQQEQKERARWMHFKDAVKCVQEECGCTDESAAEQLITAIVDQNLDARWDDEAGLEPITLSEFSGPLKICLDGFGFVKRNHETAKAKSVARWTGNYPKLQFVSGPVIDADLDMDAPLTEVNTFDYIPLPVLKEQMDQWPLDEFRNTHNTDKIRRPPEPSLAKINAVAGRIYRDNPSNPPNVVKAEQLIRKELPGATRGLIRSILAKFENQRHRPGKPPKR